jgi:hypothetical protein
MSVRGLRKTAKDTDTWKLILKEARVVHGLYREWTERDLFHSDNAKDVQYFIQISAILPKYEQPLKAFLLFYTVCILQITSLYYL